MEFRKNKKYFSSLKKESESRWICTNPLFLCGDKGLFPVYRVNGRYGVLNKNYHELILETIGENNVRSRQTVRKEQNLLNKI